MAEKQQERVTKVLAAKKNNDKDFNERMQAEDQMVKKRIIQAEASRAKQLEEMRSKALMQSITKDDESENNSIAKRINMSKSQNLRKEYAQEPNA